MRFVGWKNLRRLRDLELTDRGEITGLLRLFEVDEDRSGPVCGCFGGASFEFFTGERLLETTDLVCNDMLHWSGWPGDGALPPAKAAELLDWLAERGFPGPRDEVRADRARAEACSFRSLLSRSPGPAL